MKHILIFTFLIIMFSCNNKTDCEKARKYSWKYSTGYYTEDILEFNIGGLYKIDEKNLIYKNNILIGSVIFVNDKELNILSLKKEEGKYLMFKPSQRKK